MQNEDTLPQGQVPDHTLAAGEVLELTCPEGTNPEVTVGEGFPKEQGKTQFKILDIQGEKFTIGFIKGGTLKVEVPCSNNQKVSSWVLLKVLDPQDQPEAAPPLPLQSLAYPLWVWITLLVILGSPFTFIFYKKVKAKRIAKAATLKARPLSPSEKLEKYLKESSALLKNEKNLSFSQIKNFYSEGYTSFRNFLDSRFKLNSAHETTREFLGTLRSTASLWNLSTQDVALIDNLLSTADQVRFASESPDPDARQLFLKNIYDTYKKFQINLQPVSTDSSRPIPPRGKA